MKPQPITEIASDPKFDSPSRGLFASLRGTSGVPTLRPRSSGRLVGGVADDGQLQPREFI